MCAPPAGGAAQVIDDFRIRIGVVGPIAAQMPVCFCVVLGMSKSLYLSIDLWISFLTSFLVSFFDVVHITHDDSLLSGENSDHAVFGFLGSSDDERALSCGLARVVLDI